MDQNNYQQIQQCLNLLNTTNATAICQHVLPRDPNLQQLEIISVIRRQSQSHRCSRCRRRRWWYDGPLISMYEGRIGCLNILWTCLSHLLCTCHDAEIKVGVSINNGTAATALNKHLKILSSDRTNILVRKRLHGIKHNTT